MKTKYYNQKRQSGKTTDLINLFLSKPEKTLFLTLNQDAVNEIKHKIPQEYHKHIRSEENYTLICGYSYDRILIDEYSFIKNKGVLIYYLSTILTSDGEIIIKTTPNKQYKKQNYVIAKLLKSLDSEMRYKYLRLLTNEDTNEIGELLEDSILLSPNTQLFDPSVNKDENNWYTGAERTGEMFI